MACSSCGARIRRLAQQYPYKSVVPTQRSSEELKKVKARLKELANTSIVIEEVDSKYTQKIDDLSVIHTV